MVEKASQEFHRNIQVTATRPSQTNRVHCSHDQAVFKPSETVSPLNPHTIVEENSVKDRGLPGF